MKTERRHELQTNQLADLLGSTVESAKPFTKVAAGAVVAIVVIVGAVWYLNRQSEAAQAQGWDQLYQAQSPEQLQNLVAQYVGTPPGTWARLMLGDQKLATGIEALFNDRAEANSELRGAKDNYSLVMADRGASELAQQRAAQGLARSAEALNELPLALENYKSIVERWPDSAFAEEARNRIVDLERRSTQEFYDWFALQDPKPPADAEPSAFGSEGAMNLGLPEGPGEASDSVFDLGTVGDEGEAPATDEASDATAAESDAAGEEAVESDAPADAEDATESEPAAEDESPAEEEPEAPAEP